MTPAEALERAAAHITQLAAATSKGPWTNGQGAVQGFGAQEFAGVRDASNIIAFTGPPDDPTSVANAAWIAAMGPACAQALADLLRDHGDAMAWIPAANDDRHSAVTLARAILGERA